MDSYDDSSQMRTPHHLPLGAVLCGKYRIDGVLGEGGFGITYTGWDVALDIRVAVKEYYPTGFVTREAPQRTVTAFTGDKGEFFRKGRERFMREARTLAKFNSLPGIVSARDFFEENGTAYLVMEFIDGQTFKSYLAAMDGKLPPQQVFEMLRPVMLALQQVHSAGVIHRDVSPDNIMITNDGYMKLLDFGAAQEYADGERSRTVMVKQGYAPFEQYHTHGSQGPWTDVYALCATMYRAITGEIPPESTERMYEDTLRAPLAMGIALPADQEQALMRGLALRAEERTQEVGALLEVLKPRIDPVVIDEPEVEKPKEVKPPKPVKEKKPFVWPLPKKLTAIIAGVLVVVLAVGIGMPIAVKNRKPEIVVKILQGETRNLQFGDYLWRVLDLQDGEALLLTEDIVEQRSYNSISTDVTWETCTLRTYLNDEFYRNFSAQEQSMILEIQNVNADNPWYGTSGGNDTKDKVFLLSIEEVVKYFGDSGQLKNRIEYFIDDQYNDARAAEYNGKTAWWWLRSPGDTTDYAAGVIGDGYVYVSGGRVRAGGGVRPALWLNL